MKCHIRAQCDGGGGGGCMLQFISDLVVESSKSDFLTESIFLTCKSSQILVLLSNLILPQNGPPHLGGGGGAYKLQNIIYDPGIESAIPDFIIRSESAENDFFSKPRLHCLYVGSCSTNSC